jgi:hypothetical protein
VSKSVLPSLLAGILFNIDIGLQVETIFPTPHGFDKNVWP